MIKQHTIGYQGMLKDLSKDKQSEKYFDAKNIRILATDQQSSLALTNEAGNEQILTIPTPVLNVANTSIDYDVFGSTKSLTYFADLSATPRTHIEEAYHISGDTYQTSGTQTIIGVKELRDSVLIATTDGAGFDCFWELTGLNSGNFDLDLKYMNNLELSKDNLLQMLFNYENSVIEKIYFADGNKQLRFFNLRQSIANGDTKNLIDLDPTSIDTVSSLELSQPVVTNVISGGSHTTGMIQYAYGLYILNGSQTTISPLSELTAIDRGDGLGGGEINEVLGRSVTVQVPNVDRKFTHIKLYSIKYTSYNQVPEVKIIADQEIDGTGTFNFTDAGNAGTSISLEAFRFLGSSPLIPQHIATKDNRLFAINVKEIPFDVDLDMRAYAHNSSGTAVIWDNVYLNDAGGVVGTNSTVPANWNVPIKHDSVNPAYDFYKYQDDGSTLGGTGKYVEVQLNRTFLSEQNAEDLQFFKDREIYRIGIKFYNNKGQVSEPKWIMDIKAPSGNLTGYYNQLTVKLTPEFYVWLNDSSNFASESDKPIGYKIVRADRQESDKTILVQGMINPMVANYTHRTKTWNLSSVKGLVDSNEASKMPSITRTFSTLSPFVGCKDYHDLTYVDTLGDAANDARRNNKAEGMIASSSRDWRAQTWQHNRLIQMFSPDISFTEIQIDASYKLHIVGLLERNYAANWATEQNPVSGLNNVEAKFLNGFTPGTPGVTSQAITLEPTYIADESFYGPTNGRDTRATHQVYQSFLGTFHESNTVREYSIYGSPEVTPAGADYVAYNNDFSLRYCNHLKTMLLDDWRRTGAVHNDAEVQIRGMNSIGAKCITFVEGPDESTFPVSSRKTIEKMYQDTNIGVPGGILIAEFIKDDAFIYTGGIYGGNSYEAKKNSSYIDIGNYSDISDDEVYIESPGDIFVGTFTFSKITKDNVDIESREYNQIAEIVSIKVESSIDMKNRDDLSLGEWDNRFQPKMEEYNKYNRVYSQQPTLITSVSEGSKTKKVQEFDTRIIASKEKIPGEFIDSWTDFLDNEKMDLDGKFGPINAVTTLNDEIFCLQDTGVAHIAINPRVQVPGDDGLAIELGTGRVLHDYHYLTTTSGCLNRFGVVSTPKGFYYLDLLNKSIAMSNGSAVKGLSDAEGFHNEFVNRLSYDNIVADNTVTSSGVNCGFNPVNGDVYFSIHQPNDDFTISFNEKVGAFTSYYDYVPSWYINKGDRMITTNDTNTQLWEHFKGDPNNFYGTTYDSSVTMHIAPEGNEIILNGASYKLEMTKDGIELPKEGLTAIRVYNEYQDSGIVNLEMRKNVYKKFRNWSVKFPRNKGTRDRVRSAWGFAEFRFNNPDGKKLILHDITLFYTQH